MIYKADKINKILLSLLAIMLVSTTIFSMMPQQQQKKISWLKLNIEALQRQAEIKKLEIDTQQNRIETILSATSNHPISQNQINKELQKEEDLKDALRILNNSLLILQKALSEKEGTEITQQPQLKDLVIPARRTSKSYSTFNIQTQKIRKNRRSKNITGQTKITKRIKPKNKTSKKNKALKKGSNLLTDKRKHSKKMKNIKQNIAETDKQICKYQLRNHTSKNICNFI